MHILILDDNPCVCMMIAKAIGELAPNAELHTAHTYEAALAVMSQKRIDAAFLDIELDVTEPEKNGLILARELVKKHPAMKTIFVSSYPNYALTAYDVHPFDFVVKPVNIERLKNSANRVFQAIERETQLQFEQKETLKNERLFIRTNKEMFFLPYSEILFIEKVSKEVIIHTERGEHTVRWTLAELETMLPKVFVRVHKSFLVNADKISRISEFGDRTYEIFFGNVNKTAILSRYKVNDLFEVMNIPYKE